MSSTPNLAAILARISDGLCVYSNDRQISWANDKAAQILQAVDKDFNEKIARGIDEHCALRFEHFHSGLRCWFEHQIYPNEEGGITVFSREVTSRHRIEEALRASEEQLRRIIDANIIGVMVSDLEFITESNDAFLNMVGYTRTDVMTKKLRWRDMTPVEYDVVDAKALSEVQRTGVFAPYEKELIGRDGRRVTILAAGVRTSPEPLEILCLVMDLSARKRAEERIRYLVEGSKILDSSLEYEKTFAELAELLVPHVADCCLIHVKEDGALRQVGAAYAAPKVSADFDLDKVLTNGQSIIKVRPASSITVPIMARGEIAGALALGSKRPAAYHTDDVHLFEELARRLGLALENARLYQEAQRANRLKDEFVAIVSHELRTPLTPILGGAYMLRSDPQDADIISRALDLIERNAKAQVKIVDDLLDISRIISGKLRLNMEPLDLAAVIRAAAETVRPAAEAKDIRIDTKLRPLAAVVSGDPDRLQQIVWNLLANAVKFTPTAGEITIDLLERDGAAEIRVTDNGVGIDAAFLPHVFERFRQADTSRTRAYGGMGLGLAIVRHLVESHGGTVHVESRGDEQGSTFIVRLPFRSAARAAKKD